MTGNTLSSPVTENRLEGMQFIANFKNCSCDPIHLTQIDYLLQRWKWCYRGNLISRISFCLSYVARN